MSASMTNRDDPCLEGDLMESNCQCVARSASAFAGLSKNRPNCETSCFAIAQGHLFRIVQAVKPSAVRDFDIRASEVEQHQLISKLVILTFDSTLTPHCGSCAEWCDRLSRESGRSLRAMKCMTTFAVAIVDSFTSLGASVEYAHGSERLPPAET